MVPDRRLSGCRVVVTRNEPGELGRLLEAEGAEVIHVPLIEVVEPLDGGAALQDALNRLDDVDWLIVTSPAGADRVGAAASGHPHVRLAAVGTATAERLAALARRAVDLVPENQLAASLAEAFVEAHRGSPQRVVLALADRAASTLADELGAAGHDVVSVNAYRTVLRRPSATDLERIDTADAVLFASGSAAESWARSMDGDSVSHVPALAVAIGPTTAARAREFGLKISSVAADHSLAGLVEELSVRWRQSDGP
jgi:uroporphyrinogen-III synthase